MKKIRIKKKLSDIEKEKFNLVQELSRKGDLEGVIKGMEELVELEPNYALFRAVLANALDEFGKSDVAEKEFKKSVELDPTSEIISLGLFHCLWGQDKQIEAFDEMKRFMSISDCEDYRSILKEIKEKWVD